MRLNQRHIKWAGIVVGLAGCYSPPSAAPPPRPPMEIKASFGRTWDAVIEHFAERSIPIRTLERASGLIVTDPMVIYNDKEADLWGDCGGSEFAGQYPPTSGSFNVLVRGDSAASTIKVTARWRLKELECTTKDVFELALETAIRTRAERPKP